MIRKLFIVLLALPFIGYSQLAPKQKQQIDSSKQVLKTTQKDTIIIKAWLDWGENIKSAKPDLHLELNLRVDSLCSENIKRTEDESLKLYFQKSKIQALKHIGKAYKNRGEYENAIDFYNQMSEVSLKIGDKKGAAVATYAIAYIYKIQDQYDKAILFYNKSIKFRKAINDQKGTANALNNIGVIYDLQGNYAKAMVYFSKSLKIREEIKAKKGIASSLNNIGMVYFHQSNYEKAIEFYSRSLALKEELGDQLGLGNSLNNIGSIYSKQNIFDKAHEFYIKSLKIREKITDKKGIAQSLNNIGVVLKNQGKYNKAMAYFSKGLKISEEIKDQYEKSVSLVNIGEIYEYKGHLTKALDYSRQSLAIAQDIGAPTRVKDASKILWEVNKKLGNSEAALKMYELFVATRDSINSEENQKAVIRQEYKYQYEKQAAADSVKNAEARKVKDAQLTAEKVKNKQQKQQNYFLFVGLAIALLFGGFIFNRFRITNKQKGIIEEQKEKVDTAYDQLETKNKEVLDSITYAKRIQSAMLPKQKSITALLPRSFVLYKPKDIVAGDFYWLEQKGNKTFFAAADCTGHGVPGAMVSVVCNNALNKSINQYKLTLPGQILDTTREIIIHEFEKSEEEVKDGMDIALCALDGNTLQYAGAYNPLWIVRNGVVLETKADKQPIGRFGQPKAFTTHTLTLEKGDTIYIFTDGYVDQFGGKKGKKLKAKALRTILLSIQNLSMKEQKEYLDEAFENWRGNHEQIDDVCIFGIRV